MDPALEAAGLLLRADLEPVLEQDDAGVDHRLLNGRDLLEEPSCLLRCAEAHDALDTCPVVPASVEDHDLPGRREMLQIALDVHLRLLALGRSGECHDLEDARADALGDPLDRAALARRVPAL